MRLLLPLAFVGCAGFFVAAFYITLDWKYGVVAAVSYVAAAAIALDEIENEEPA